MGGSVRDRDILKGSFKYLNDISSRDLFIYFLIEKGTSLGLRLPVQSIIGSTSSPIPRTRHCQLCTSKQPTDRRLRNSDWTVNMLNQPLFPLCSRLLQSKPPPTSQIARNYWIYSPKRNKESRAIWKISRLTCVTPYSRQQLVTLANKVPFFLLFLAIKFSGKVF